MRISHSIWIEPRREGNAIYAWTVDDLRHALAKLDPAVPGEALVLVKDVDVMQPIELVWWDRENNERENGSYQEDRK